MAALGPIGIHHPGWGETGTDAMWRKGQLNKVREWCKIVRDTGVLVAVTSHRPEVFMEYRVPGLGRGLLHDLPVQVWPHPGGMGEGIRVQPWNDARGVWSLEGGQLAALRRGNRLSCAAIRRRCTK